MSITPLVMAAVNVLEGSTVTVPAAATGFPGTRLYDRDIDSPWQDTTNVGVRDVIVDQGAGSQAVDRWIVPPGHAFTGASLILASSPDGILYTDRDSFVPGSSAVIYRVLGAAITTRFWRLRIAGGALAPAMAELFLSLGVTLGAPALGSWSSGYMGQVSEHVSRSGYTWAYQRGPALWKCAFTIPNLARATVLALEAVFATTLGGGAKFVWLTDIDGVPQWVKWQTYAIQSVDVAMAIERYTMGFAFQAAR